MSVLTSWQLLHKMLASPVAQQVKNLPAMQETQQMRVLSLVRKIPWKRKWQPTPVFLPGKLHGQRSLEGYSLKVSRVTHTGTHTHTHTHTHTRCEHQGKLDSACYFHIFSSSLKFFQIKVYIKNKKRALQRDDRLSILRTQACDQQENS